jgi:hypothetical protein
MKRSHNGRLTDSCLERPYVPSIPPESPKSTVLFSKSDSAAMRKSRGTSREAHVGINHSHRRRDSSQIRMP